MSITEKLVIIAENEPKVYGAGYDKGYETGYKEGYDEGFQNGDVIGYENAELAFWRGFVKDRTDWSYAFQGWGHEHIEPAVKIELNSTYYAFYKCKYLKEVKKDYFDFSKATPNETSSNSGNSRTFYMCPELEYIEDVGIPSGYYLRTFDGDKKLHTIYVLRSTKATMWSNAFAGCGSLVHIGAILDNDGNQGVIGQNGFDVSMCDLDAETVDLILTVLYDYVSDGDTTKRAITIGPDNQEKVPRSKIQEANNKGWDVL